MEIVNGQKYIVRCNRSGVFYGEIARQDGAEVQLVNARCLWYWDGAASLMQLALEGTSKPDNCKFTVSIEEVTVLDAIEIVKCTDKAQKSIEAVKAWRA